MRHPWSATALAMLVPLAHSDKGDDAVVKAFAAKTLPVISQHLEEAKKLAQ
jgi:uncharacterized protein DUF4142